MLLDYVNANGTCDARDVDDVYKQLVENGETFDIDWASQVPYLDELGLRNVEEADRFVKKNASRFSTNPTLLNQVNTVLAFCVEHNLHEVKAAPVDPDTKAWNDGYEESERLINEWKVSDVRQTSSQGGKYELFNKKITALRTFRDNAVHNLKTNRLPQYERMTRKRKGEFLVDCVREYGEKLFNDSPFLGA